MRAASSAIDSVFRFVQIKSPFDAFNTPLEPVGGTRKSPGVRGFNLQQRFFFIKMTQSTSIVQILTNGEVIWTQQLIITIK